MQIDRCRPEDFAAWLPLRIQLWPDHTDEENRAQAFSVMESEDSAGFIAKTEDGVAVGFAEVALRYDYVNGCGRPPVAFLEGIYVVPDWRGKGVARALVGAVESWSGVKGVTELASDVLLGNTTSQGMHQALGFEETERVVYYRKVVERAR
ncbi:aminoglycoside 6'-N-acetyltransferase [Methyloligella halotolerans]|nr:aminoglycoside 6'-N-acetyltransferase [Methyloligella halotolerans]